jgi:hypothetical protein
LHYKFGLSINLPTFDTYSKNFKIQVHKPFEQIAVFDFA